MTRSIVVEPASVTNAQVSRVASTRSCNATTGDAPRGMHTGDKRNELPGDRSDAPWGGFSRDGAARLIERRSLLFFFFFFGLSSHGWC
jgi:hypothetical protein